MESLIPKIEIGKRYKFRDSPIELVCSGCGAAKSHKDSTPDSWYEAVVVVDSPARFAPKCTVCGTRSNQSGEGWYNIHEADNPLSMGLVPYTQLSPIKEE